MLGSRQNKCTMTHAYLHLDVFANDQMS